LLGGHWFAIQSIAWITMIVDQSQDASLVDAVTKTFDGEYRCLLCEAVASGQEKEREQRDALVDPAMKLVAVLPIELPSSFPRFSKLTYFSLSSSMYSVDGGVPSPPPRAI